MFPQFVAVVFPALTSFLSSSHCSDTTAWGLGKRRMQCAMHQSSVCDEVVIFPQLTAARVNVWVTLMCIYLATNPLPSVVSELESRKLVPDAGEKPAAEANSEDQRAP